MAWLCKYIVSANMRPQLGNAEDKSRDKIDTSNQLLIY